MLLIAVLYLGKKGYTETNQDYGLHTRFGHIRIRILNFISSFRLC